MNTRVIPRTVLGVFCLVLGLAALLGPLRVGSTAATPGVYKLEVLQSLGFTEGQPYGASPVRDAAGNLYGTTYNGGQQGYGTVYKIAPDGTYDVLHDFNNSQGANPYVGVTLGADGSLYGTTVYGGSLGQGTVYRIAPDGTYVVLYDFDGSQGSYPLAGVTLGADGSLYGTTTQGGSSGYGAVYKIAPDGAYSMLHDFNDSTQGAYPYAGVTLGADGSLYGTTYSGGSSGYGTVYKLAADGTYAVLHDFNKSQGAYPYAGVTLAADGSLYGSTREGGSSGYGTVYKLAADGTYSMLHDFNDYTQGAYPYAGVTLGADGSLYGTTYSGGSSGGCGKAYKIAPDGTYAVLHDFNNSQGACPQAGVIFGVDGSLYGTTQGGGSSGIGTVYKLAPDGTYAVLHNFDGTHGADPYAGVTLAADSSLYGTTYQGGSSGNGTVYKIAPDGTYSVLNDFDGTHGAFPYAGVTLAADGSLYGTTYQGGSSGYGTVYKIAPDGTHGVVHDFDRTHGANPYAGVALGADGSLYGTTQGGGSSGYGTVYKIAPDGTHSMVHDFTNTSQGANPFAGVSFGADGSLYGTTLYGGSSGYGTVYKIAPDGAYSVLHEFDGSQGSHPYARVSFGADGSLYGTAQGGGSSGYGTVYKIAPDGTYAVLHDFNNSQGAYPQAGVSFGADGSLYGTTQGGGSSGYGTVYKIAPDGTYAVLHDFNKSQGAYPQAGVSFGADGSLYGTTVLGGPYYVYKSRGGVIYRLRALAATASALASSLNPAWPGASLTLTAMVTGDSPTGEVSFLDGTAPLGTATLSNGQASFTTAGLSVGSHALTARYEGDDNNAASESPVLTQMVNADGTAPVIAPTVTGTLGNNGWYVSDVGVSWSVTDPESPVTSQTGCETVTVTADTAGQTFTCTATSAGGTASNSVTVKRDATAPVITLSTPPNGAAYAVDAVVYADYACTDTGSGVESCLGQVESGARINTATLGTPSFLVNATDRAGNTASITHSYSVTDASPPVIVPTVTGALGNNGWYVSDVGVSWSVTDPESPVTSQMGCEVMTVTADTAGQTFTCQATSAGGTATQSATVKRDATAPVITLATPQNGQSYLLNSSVLADYGCSDGLSGIATCAGPVAAGAAIDTAASGAHAFTVAAADQAGNQAAVTHSYSVAAVPVVLNVNRTGQGGVISDPAGINCGSQCRATFARGANVVLAATPAYGYRFAGWSGGACSGTGPCGITLDGNRTVTANFTPIPRYGLVVIRSGSGTVTSSPAGINCGRTCGAQFYQGTTVTLTATPAAGRRFAGWSGGGCSGTGACTVTMNRSTQVRATFR